jgi:hypothetical protein
MTDVVQQLIDTINATGGVMHLPNGMTAPVGDPTWEDLAEVYLLACAEKKVEPLWAPYGEDET